MTAKRIEAAVNGFKPENKANVLKVLGALDGAVKILYKPLMAVAYVSNLDAANVKSESESNLVELLKVLGLA